MVANSIADVPRADTEPEAPTPDSEEQAPEPEPTCDACGEPLGDGKSWTDVPRFGDLCNPCHEAVFEDGRAQFKNRRHFMRWLEGLCDCSKAEQAAPIGVWIRCRGCGGWRP